MNIDIKEILVNYIIANKNSIYYVLESIIKLVLFYGGIMSFAGLLTIAERKISALIQDRIGPNRANVFKFTLWGLFHPLADGIKMIVKEDFIPEKANKILFTLAPVISLVPVLIVFSFIPFGNYLKINDYVIHFQIFEVDLSIFLLIAISSLAIYGTFLGGFVSANNWGLIGSIRAQAQMISYEVIMALSILPVLMIYSATSFSEIVAKQSTMLFGFLPNWGIFLQPVSFLIFITAALMESKRTPFDVVEGESEIIGYFIEHGSMRFAAFMLGEYLEIILFSMLASIFFLGGYNFPFLQQDGFVIGNFHISLNHYFVAIIELLSFAIKTAIFSFFIIFTRWTLLRFRFDQIMKLSWNYLLPISIFNLMITALILRLL